MTTLIRTIVMPRAGFAAALPLLVACASSAGARSHAIAAAESPGADSSVVAIDETSKLRLPRGRVTGGCPVERNATCLGVETAEFAIDAAPVSRDDYLRCVNAGACPDYGPGGTGEEDTEGPTLGVEAGERYCAWRGERLPTEPEWERARLEASGFVTPRPPMIKELLFGWYTWWGPDAIGEPGDSMYNSRLVIRILDGKSYRYGIHTHEPTPDLTFRCVASRERPAPDGQTIAR